MTRKFSSDSFNYQSASMRLSWFCLVFLTFMGVSCSEDDGHRARVHQSVHTPALELRTNTDMGSILTFQNMLLGRGQDGFLYIWKWTDLNVRPQRIKLDLWYPLREWEDMTPLNRGCTLISPGRLICSSHTDDDTFIVLRTIKGDHEFKRWSFGKRWWCRRLQNARNGKYVAVYLDELFGDVLKDKNRTDKGRHRFGVISSQSDEIRWLSTVYRTSVTLPYIRNIAVSEDGNYLAAVGNADGGGFIHLADVAQKKVLWEKVPHGEEVPLGTWTVNFNAVCFSPDSKYVYVGGNCGLFRFDVTTGKILSQWRIGGRCISVAASPDGRLVAVGGEVTGLVHICDAKTGKLLRRRRTGQYTIYGLAFSADSTLLATSGVMKTNIKIWKMPSASSDTKSKS